MIVFFFIVSYPFEYVLVKLGGGNDLFQKYYSNGVTYKAWYEFMQEYKKRNNLNFNLLLYLPSVVILLLIIDIVLLIW